MLFHFFIDLAHQIIDLSFHRTDRDFRVQKPCRADDLLRTQEFMFRLISRRRRRHEHHLVDMCLKLLKIQRTVIKCGRQTEAIIHQCLFSRSVAKIHAADLRKRNMGLVHDDQKIIRKIVEQRTRWLPRCGTHEMAGIVLDPGAESSLPHHLHVKVCPLSDPLCLQELILTFKEGYLLLHLCKNILSRTHHLFLRNDIVGCREDRHMFQLCLHLSGQRLDLHDPVHLVPEELDPVRLTSGVCRKYFQHISSHTETSSFKIHLISCILDIDQFVDHFISVFFHSRAQRDHHVLIIDRASQTIDTRYRSYNDHIIPLRKGRCRRMAQLIDLIVDRGVLFNISIRRRHIGLRLIVVVIGYKVFHRIIWEKLLHLRIKLCCQRLIVRDHKRWLIQLLDHVRHRKCFTGSSHTEQCLKLIAFPEAFYQLFDCLRLVTGRLIF